MCLCSIMQSMLCKLVSVGSVAGSAGSFQHSVQRSELISGNATFCCCCRLRGNLLSVKALIKLSQQTFTKQIHNLCSDQKVELSFPNASRSPLAVYPYIPLMLLLLSGVFAVIITQETNTAFHCIVFTQSVMLFMCAYQVISVSYLHSVCSSAFGASKRKERK